jgi:hypothetical protein
MSKKRDMGHPEVALLEGVDFAEELEDGGDGEAYYVEEVAFDAGDPAGSVALDAVGSGFVEGVVGGEVVGQFGFGDRGEEDAGGFYVRAVMGGGDDGDAGVDLVGAVGELAEHAFGVGNVCRFVEDLLSTDYSRVGSEDGGFGVEGLDGLRFFEGEALDVGGGGFVGVEGLVDVGGEDVEAQAGLGEEVAAAGRGGGEDEHFELSVVSCQN